jgi:hypothetical protein
MLKMKNTRKLSITMMLCLLVLSLVMYNCKKDDPLPTEPDQGKVDDLNKIEIAPVTITPPAAVATTEASVEVSAKATEVNGALGGIAASGTVPASVSEAAAAVSAAVPAADLATLSAVTPAQIAAVKAGGAIPAEVKAALDKAAANPAVQAYLPKFTLPTVGGVTVTGRVAAPAGVAATTANAAVSDAIEAIQEASDACIAAADGVYNTKKAALDATKATNDAAVTTAYNTAVTAIPAVGACTDPLTAKYAALRAAVDAQVNQALADVDAAQAVLGDLYPLLKTLINIQALNAYAGLNTVQAAEVAACTVASTQRLAAATAARDANLAASQAAYATAIAAANVARTALIQSCHNQGGGN